MSRHKHAVVAFLGVVFIVFCGASALAEDPTLHQVYQAVEAGQYAQAKVMMDRVLRDHPNSAKAHFVEAELFSKEGRLDEAREELAIAERIKPNLPFVKPEVVRALKARLASTNSVGASVPFSNDSGSIPWGMVILVIGSIVLAIRFMSRRDVMPVSYGAGGYGPSGYAPGSQTPMQPAGGIGSSVVNSLATGVAVGAGVAAGEAIVNKFIGGNAANTNVEYMSVNPGMPEQNDMSDTDFGIVDNSSWDDSSVGGDDWDN